MKVVDGPPDIAAGHVQHVLRSRGQSSNMMIPTQNDGRDIHAVHQVHQIIVESVELEIAVVQIIIERGGFFVGRLQFFFGRFQFFIGALKLFIAGEGFLIGGFELFVHALVLINDRL